jgi:hypothetical protein
MDGIEQTATVAADSLFEAVARGIVSLKKQEWIDRLTLEGGTVTVAVGDVPVEHRVELREFNKWVQKPGGGSPREVFQRSKIREILRAIGMV